MAEAASPTTGRRVIVSAADTRYFRLLRGLLESLVQRGARQLADLAVLDVGLAPAQIESLHRVGIKVVPAVWGFDFPLRAEVEAAIPGFKAMTSRPLLRDLLPGYDSYLWLDADTWVQTDDVVPMFFQAASNDTLAAVLSIDRSYATTRNGRHAAANRRLYRTLAPDHAAALSDRPNINSGALALPATAPHWERWHDMLRSLLERRTDFVKSLFMIEQVALNAAMLEEGLRFHPLPTRCNWVCPLALPIWDGARSLLCEPYAPYDPIGLIHLADWIKQAPQTIRSLDGATLTMNLRYPPAVVEAVAGEIAPAP